MLLPILLAIGIPIVVSCLLLFAGWFAVRRNQLSGLPWWSVAGAVALGYAAGHYSLSGWPQFPPGDVTHWLPFVAISALLAAAILSLRGTRGFVWVVRIAIALVTTCMLASPLFKSQPTMVAS